MKQCILSTGCLNESGPSPFFLAEVGGYALLKGSGYVSQAGNINSHLLDIGRYISVAITYVQHFKLLFFSEDEKPFHRPPQTVSRETSQSCMQMLLKYPFPLLLRNLGFPHQECDRGKKLYVSFAFLPLADHTSSQFKSKWPTVLPNTESKPHFRSPVKLSF